MSTHHIVTRPGLAFVELAEYERLVTENEDMLKRIVEKDAAILTRDGIIDALRSENDVFRHTIKRNDEELSILREANAVLKLKLTELEAKVTGLTDANATLTAANVDLTGKVETLTTANVTLTAANVDLTDKVETLTGKVDRIDQERRDEKLTTKLILAIQDINTADQLERQLHGTRYCRYLRRLRDGRNDIAHYVLDDDSAEVKAYKRSNIRQTLVSLTPQFKSKFEAQVGEGLVNVIIGRLNPVSNINGLTQDDRDDADIWLRY